MRLGFEPMPKDHGLDQESSTFTIRPASFPLLFHLLICSFNQWIGSKLTTFHGLYSKYLKGKKNLYNSLVSVFSSQSVYENKSRLVKALEQTNKKLGWGGELSWPSLDVYPLLEQRVDVVVVVVVKTYILCFHNSGQILITWSSQIKKEIDLI